MRNLALLSLVSAALVSGCTIRSTSSGSSGSGTMTAPPTQLHSASIDVSEMRASMSAQAGDSTVKIYAAVFASSDQASNAPVILDPGDFFTAQIGSADPIVLVREPAEDPSSVHYTATIPAPSAGEDVIVSLTRPKGKAGAPSSLVHVPDPFSILSTPPVSVKHGDSLTVQLSRSLSPLAKLEVSGICLDPDKNPSTWIALDFNNQMTIDTTGLVYAQGQNSGCDVSFYLSDVDEGSLDPAFAGGVSGLFDVEGIQKRGLDTSVVP